MAPLFAAALTVLGCAPSGDGSKNAGSSPGVAEGSSRALGSAAAPPGSSEGPSDLADAAPPTTTTTPTKNPASDDNNKQNSLGREVAPPRARPEAVLSSACSFEEPVCVHIARGVSIPAAGAALRHAESALHALRALGLPLPLPDGLLGGGPALDLYLVPGAEPPFVAADLDMRAAFPLDRSSAFVVLPPPEPWGVCEDRTRVALAVAEASIMGLDAGAEPGVVRMAASYIATLIAPCNSSELLAIDAFQRAPEQALTDPPPPGSSLLDGALLFPWYLDEAHGLGRPSAVITGLLTVAAQRTPPGAWTYRNEPDTFDALRLAMRDRGSTLDDLLLDFAVTRAFLGDRSDEAHLTDAARFGPAGRVRFEWSVPFASLPRRLAPLRPIQPTGAAYLWLDLFSSPAPAPPSLTFVADWELDVLFRWALVKVDRSGQEVGRITVPGIFGSTHAEQTIVGLDDLAGLLVVGVNTGSMDRSRPFDPDEAPFMPRSFTVTLYP